MIAIPVHVVMLDALGMPEGHEQDIDLLERVADFVIVEKLAAALVGTRMAARDGRAGLGTARDPADRWWRHTAADSGLRSGFRKLSAVLPVLPVGIDLRTIDDLGARQSAKLRAAGIEDRDGAFLSIRTSLGTLEFEIERGSPTTGSYRARRLVRITARGARRFLLELVAAALVTAALPEDVSELFWGSDRVHYVCTIESFRPGDEAELVEKAARDLLVTDVMAAEERREAVRARQLCLRASGFDPGPIDGIFGPRSERAAEAYAYFHHGIRTNWDSTVFLEQLVETAMKRMRHAPNQA